MEQIIKKWEEKLNKDKRKDVYYTRELLNEMIADFKQITISDKQKMCMSCEKVVNVNEGIFTCYECSK